jgi:hypothetical protein
MRVVPSSPRLRRRFLRVGIALLVAGSIATIAVLVRGPKGPSSSPAKNAPPAQFAAKSTRVSPAERRAIDKTLDQFIPAALDRTAAKTAWRLAGPELKSGSTLKEWRHGTSPIPYYPARGTSFHNWTTIDAGPNYVEFNILVHPKRGSQTSSWVFSGEVVKRQSHWLVNRMYTIAVMQRPTKTGRHEVGPADFAASPAAQSNGGAPPPTGASKLGTKWLYAVGGAVLLALLFPLGFGIVSVVRSRRARLNYARSEGRALPPLPRNR